MDIIACVRRIRLCAQLLAAKYERASVFVSTLPRDDVKNQIGRAVSAIAIDDAEDYYGQGETRKRDRRSGGL
jgi:hypothetical protein